MNLKEQLDAVNQRLAELSKSLAPLMAAQEKSMTATGKGLDAFVESMSLHGGELEKLTKQYNNLKAAIGALETAEAPAGRPGAGRKRRSLGRRFSDAKGFKDWRKSRGGNGLIVELGSIWAHDEKSWDTPIETKADEVPLDGVDATDIIAPDFIRPAIPIAQPMAVMRGLCTVITTSSNTAKVGRETEFNKIITKLTADEGIGTTVFAVENVEGFDTESPFSEITLRNGAATEKLILDSIQTAASTLTTTVASTIALTVANGTIVASAYAPTPSGLIAPRASKVFKDFNINVVDISSEMIVTLNQLADIPTLENSLNTNLFSSLAEMEDVNFFYASGGATGMIGVFKDATLLASNLVLSAQAVGSTELDLILEAYYQVIDDNYLPGDTVVSPDVHKRLVKIKASDGQYIFWNSVPEGGGATQVFAMRLHMANTMIAQSGIVAEFPRAFYIIDRASATIEIGTVDKQLSKRERTMLANERVGFGVVRPEAARTMTFDALPV